MGNNQTYKQYTREKTEDRLNIKEEELNIEEKRLAIKRKRLTTKEKELQNKEEELKTKENRPKHVFYACVLIGGFIYFVSTKDFSQVDYTPRNITTNTRGISTSNLPSKRKSAGRGKDISSAYRGLEVDDPDFDVGRYCLRKEKSGVMTFEECLGMAALKLTAGR